MRPILAITTGDPAGIGPEIVVNSLTSAVLCSTPIVFGHWPTFERVLNDYNSGPNNSGSNDTLPPIERTTHPTKPKEGTIQFVHVGPDCGPIDTICAASAESQFASLRSSVDAILAGTCNAVVTAPVSKVSVAQVSPGFTGHTEYLAERCNLRHDDVTMIFASGALTVGLVATHLPLCEIPSTITTERYSRTLKHVIESVRGLQPNRKPRIGVAALNPHGGENGLLGKEEIETIGPFCEESQQLYDADICGPYPADTIFRDAFDGKYDGVVAAYHDQAMIPLKLNGFGTTVNITMGLPFIRTSPDHGVAYDLARKGVANPDGMKKAIEMASLLWNNRPSTPK